MARPGRDLTAFVGELLEEQDGDVPREGVQVLSQALMEDGGAGLTGAERYERTGERAGYRNGTRPRRWDTRVGTVELAIPKVRPGTCFPSPLQPRRRAEHAFQRENSGTRPTTLHHVTGYYLSSPALSG